MGQDRIQVAFYEQLVAAVPWQCVRRGRSYAPAGATQVHVPRQSGRRSWLVAMKLAWKKDHTP
jgi:hypothetical protein